MKQSEQKLSGEYKSWLRSAEVYRDQLRLAADEIIRLRWLLGHQVLDGAKAILAAKKPWWQRIFRKPT